MGKITFDFSGQVAAVTGGARGIGKGSAEAFAEAGARVFVVDVDEPDGEAVARDIRKRGGNATFLACDVTEARRVKATKCAPKSLKHSSWTSGTSGEVFSTREELRRKLASAGTPCRRSELDSSTPSAKAVSQPLSSSARVLTKSRSASKVKVPPPTSISRWIEPVFGVTVLRCCGLNRDPDP